MTSELLLRYTNLEICKHVPLIGAGNWHTESLGHLFEEVLCYKARHISVITMRLKSQPIKFLNADFVTLDNAHHSIKEICAVYCATVLLIVFWIIIHCRVDLLESCLRSAMSIHSRMFSSLRCFSLSVVVDVRNVSRDNSIDSFNVLLWAEKFIYDWKFVLIICNNSTSLHGLKIVSLSDNGITIVGCFINS